VVPNERRAIAERETAIYRYQYFEIFLPKNRITQNHKSDTIGSDDTSRRRFQEGGFFFWPGFYFLGGWVPLGRLPANLRILTIFLFFQASFFINSCLF
jgi:hypothetical protein